MKHLLFGGGGFIGSTIADSLLADGQTVRIFERPGVAPYRKFASNERLDWFTGDMSNTHDLMQALEDIDTVLHLVSTTLPKGSNDNPIYDVETNVVSSLRLLEVMRNRGVRRILFISSGGTVYGPPQYLPVDERHPTEPQVSYGVTKLAIEKYLLIEQRLHGLLPTILRVANPYGERQNVASAQGAVGVFLQRALHGQPIEIWGDGSVVRDFIHVSDVASAFNCALRYEGPHVVFNISSGHGITLNELVFAIEQLLGRRVACRYHPGRPFDVPVNILSSDLAQQALNWAPRVSLEDGLRRTATWLEAQTK